MRKTMIFAAAIVVAGAAFAHTGVKNAAVKARMDAMSAIGAEMKVLGQMAKGATEFNATRARAAAATISKHAAATPKLFKAKEDDPKSEARDEIWTNFSDFSAKSKDLQRVAAEWSEDIGSRSDLPRAMKSLGATCKACHKAYRE